MAKTLSSLNELDVLMDASTNLLSKFLVELGLVIAKERLLARRDRQSEREALANIGDLFRKSQGIADALGRKRFMMETSASRKQEEQDFAEEPASNPHEFNLNLSFQLPFQEALDAIIESRVFNDRQQDEAREDINDVYGDDRPVLNFNGVEAARERTEEKINDIIFQDIASGTPPEVAIGQIEEELQDWSKGKGQVIHRTLTAQAYTAGRWRQIEQPEIKDSIGGVQFIATDDSDVRPSHLALNGLIFSPRNPIWSQISPPVHYNCRCTIRSLSFLQMRRMGRLDESQTNSIFPSGTPIWDDSSQIKLPDPRFASRPDRKVYAMA